MTKKIPPISPGEIFLESWLKPLNLSQSALARELFVTAPQINGIVKGERRITPDMALRLSRYFGTTAEFWMNMQQHYDLEVAKEKNLEEIERRVIPRPTEEMEEISV